MNRNGPASGSQVIAGAAKDSGISAVHCTWSRLSELRTLGVIEEAGLVLDKNTGHEVILWDVTDRLPSGKVTRVRKTTKREQQLESEIVRLKHRVNLLLERLRAKTRG